MEKQQFESPSIEQSEHPLVGQRVLNVHRQSCDMPQSFRDAHKGVITSVLEGCNPLVVVQFDGLEFPSTMVPNDLAFCELWPQEGCRVVVHSNFDHSTDEVIWVTKGSDFENILQLNSEGEFTDKSITFAQRPSA